MTKQSPARAKGHGAGIETCRISSSFKDSFGDISSLISKKSQERFFKKKGLSDTSVYRKPKYA